MDGAPGRGLSPHPEDPFGIPASARDS